MSYFLIKNLHILFASLSICLFILRAAMNIFGEGIPKTWWAKRLPHINDSALLACAISLSVMSAQYPFVHAWLSAKLLALIAYILVGSIALKRAKTHRGKLSATLLALAIFAFIVGAALNHSPWSWLA